MVFNLSRNQNRAKFFSLNASECFVPPNQQKIKKSKKSKLIISIAVSSVVVRELGHHMRAELHGSAKRSKGKGYLRRNEGRSWMTLPKPHCWLGYWTGVLDLSWSNQSIPPEKPTSSKKLGRLSLGKVPCNVPSKKSLGSEQELQFFFWFPLLLSPFLRIVRSSRPEYLQQ